MRIQHNIMAMNAYRNYNTNTKALSGNLEKLSSGYKINRAGDDAAGLAISEKMRAQITGLDAAQKNVKDGISLVKTAEGAMQEIQDMLNRMDYLATQSANGTYQNEVDRENLQKEVNNLKTEINRIADSANFNGIKLLDGSQAATGADTNSKFKGWDSIKGALAAGLGDVNATTSTSQLNLAKLANETADLKDGDVINFNLGMSDGNAYEFTATVKVNDAGDKYTLVDKDGNALTEETAYADGTTKLTTAVYTDALKKSVENSELGGVFKVTVDATTATPLLTLTAKEKGAGPAIVTSVDVTVTDKAGATRLEADANAKGRASVDPSTKAGEDAYQALDLSKAKIWGKELATTNNITNSLEKATFEINGEKFVFIDPDQATDENIAKMREAGIEHWVEVGTTDTIANTDVDKMVEKIKHSTGLNVQAGEIDGGEWKTATPANNTWIKINDGASSKKGGGLTLQIGDTSDKFNQMQVQIGDMHVNAMGTGKTTLDGQEVKVTKTIADIDIGTQEGAAEAIAVIKNAINYVSSIRGDLGAVQNRLEHTQNNLGVMAENIQDAESTIRDTDVANEMMSYVKNNILVQSAQAMLAQANQVPQGVLQLLG